MYVREKLGHTFSSQEKVDEQRQKKRTGRIYYGKKDKWKRREIRN